MAEGFARTYGSDVIVPASAGLLPAVGVARDTVRAMAEKNIDLRDHFTKSVQQLSKIDFELIVNMSGRELPEAMTAPERIWHVRDPIGTSFEVHCQVRDQIENLVMELVLELRRGLTQTSRL